MKLLKEQNVLKFIYEPSFGGTAWLKEKYDDFDDDCRVAGTFVFKKSDILEIDDEVATFKLGILVDDYYKIDKRILNTSFDVYIDKNFKINFKMISCSKYKNVFEFIDSIRKDKKDIFIGGPKSTLDVQDFCSLIEHFPSPYEMELYKNARISQVLENYFENVENYSYKLEKYRDKKDLTKKAVNNFYTEYDLLKYENILEKLKQMLKDENKYSESQWGNELANILLILFPKYINFYEQVEVRMTLDTSNKKKEKLDFMLVKSDGCIDILEIKKSSDISLITSGCDHDNHYATSSLSKVTMQIEKYIFNIARDSLNFEKELNEKYLNQYNDSFKFRVANPKGLIIMGLSNKLNEKQLLDLEIIRKMYSNIVDIYTSPDSFPLEVITRY